MSNPIDNLMLPTGPDIYYDPAFRITIETHLNYLRTHRGSVMLDVTPSQAYRHEGDFYAILTELKIPLHLHWVCLRLNNLSSPADSTQELSFVIYPNADALALILQRHRIAEGKTN